MILLGFFLISLLLVVLQVSILMPTPVWPLAPDLYYVLMAYLAYRVDLLRGVILLFPLGCMLDLFSGTIPGLYPAICFGGYGILKLMALKLPVRKSLYQIPMVGVSYLLISWIIFVFLFLLKTETIIPWSWPAILSRALLVTLLARPLFACFEKYRKFLAQGWRPLSRIRIRSGNRYRRP